MSARLRNALLAFAMALFVTAPAAVRAGGGNLAIDRLTASDGGPLRESAHSVQMAALAGGASAAEAADCQREFLALARQLRESLAPTLNKRQRAAAIHRFLHGEILRGSYQQSSDAVHVALDGGAFNCVSASALFLALAAACDLEAHAVAIPGHVWCRVNDDQSSFDVEATCRNWFELLDRPTADQTNSTSKLLGDHRSRVAKARVLDWPALLAIFHYNRGVRLLCQEQFAAAAAANLTALALDPRCELAYGNLWATVHNWSLPGHP